MCKFMWVWVECGCEWVWMCLRGFVHVNIPIVPHSIFIVSSIFLPPSRSLSLLIHLSSIASSIQSAVLSIYPTFSSYIYPENITRYNESDPLTRPDLFGYADGKAEEYTYFANRFVNLVVRISIYVEKARSLTNATLLSLTLTDIYGSALMSVGRERHSLKKS